MDAITKIITPDTATYNTAAIKPPESRKEQSSASASELHNQDIAAKNKKLAGQKDKTDNKTDNKDTIEEKSAEQNTELFKLKAVFAVDKDKNTVIQFIDKKGEVKQQFPPEEYLAMAKKMKEITKNLYSKKA